MTGDITIQSVLLSVRNKDGLKTLAKGFLRQNPSCKLIASPETGERLKEGDIPFTPLPTHQSVLDTIDLVVCNLYDVKKAAQNKNVSLSEIADWMDISGSTLIRSACKNYQSVTVIVDPNDYPVILRELKDNKGKISLKTRERLAVKALNLSATHEALIARAFGKQILKDEPHCPHLKGNRTLPYSENPEQLGWVYNFADYEGLSQAKHRAGKELSVNNYENGTIAYFAAQELLGLGAKHGIAIVKHGSLCAYATGNTLVEGFKYAWEGDTRSAFGSVIASTSEVDMELSIEIKNKFIEVLIAPKFSDAFVEWVIGNKPRLRLLEVPSQLTCKVQYKNISGEMKVQTRKSTLTIPEVDKLFHPPESKQGNKVGIVTKKSPNPNQKGLFAFGIAAVNFAKSNAVAIVREPKPGVYQLLGMGAGQPNRIDSLERLAIPKAVENLQNEHQFKPSYDPKTDLSTCVIASDGSFTFDDSIRYAAASGIKFCVQPGGSKSDPEVIQAADEHEMCMLFTGERYFYH